MLRSDVKQAVCALVLGGYVNGYSIIRELSECGVEQIYLFDFRKSLASRSNRISGFSLIARTASSLSAHIQKLYLMFESIVVYPTDDLQLEMLHEIYDEISEFCFLPFNRYNLLEGLDKGHQYSVCERIGIPYPKTRELQTCSDLESLEELMFPLIIKPNKRDDLMGEVFRNLFLKDPVALSKNLKSLKAHLKNGITFVVSECVPGDDTNIFAYTAYRSFDGEIKNEWIGKKLTQFPDLFGIFSSASNEAPEVVKVQGQRLLEAMNIMGIAEPEFKYDTRDGKYKLMEVNLRSMMWHRVGNLTGVNLQHSQWLDATGQKIPRQVQTIDERVHFVFMKHELINLLSRKGYWKHFKYAIWGVGERYFAVFDKSDMKPFFYDLKSLFRSLIGQWLRILSIR